MLKGINFWWGSIGARKSRKFSAETDVVVISKEFTAESFGKVEKIRAAPGSKEIESWIDQVDPFIIVAATNRPEVNEAIEEAARDRSILTNRVDRTTPTNPVTSWSPQRSKTGL